MFLRSRLLLAAASLAVADQVVFLHIKLFSDWQVVSAMTSVNFIGDATAVHSEPFSLFGSEYQHYALELLRSARGITIAVVSNVRGSP